MDEELHWSSLRSTVVTGVSLICVLCRRTCSQNDEANESFDTLVICGDCRVLFLEDQETNARTSQLQPQRGRSRYRSSESIEDLFSQEFSHLINLVRQSRHSNSANASRQYEQGPQLDGDIAPNAFPRSSSHTPQSRSRRWRRVLSENDSDSFDNIDSLAGRSDSNISFNQYGPLAGDSDGDTVSMGAYGGDSDASVGGHGNLFDREFFFQPEDESVVYSDIDIDPMDAGVDQWYTDDRDENIEWEEASINDVEAQNENNIRHLLFHPSGYGGDINRLDPYIRNDSDFLDTRGFEQLLDHLAEIDVARRDAPPASLAFVGSLPFIVIASEHEKNNDDLICPVCKDPLAIGTKANQLPCLHLYHPNCILPWLNTRNTCPVCRYELPTDDKDYEQGKRAAVDSATMEIHDIQQGGLIANSSDDEADENHDFTQIADRADLNGMTLTLNRSNGEGGHGGWLVLAAAAPVVSIVGIVLVFWFKNCHLNRSDQGSFEGQNVQSSSRTLFNSTVPEQRERRRWWLFWW